MAKIKTKSKVDFEQMSTNEILFTLLADRIGAVDPKQVFYAEQIDSGPNAGKYICTLGGKKLTPNQTANLQQEVMMLEKTEIWHTFTKTLSHEARLRMFEKSKTNEDMFFGKAILHAIGVFEAIVHSIQYAMRDEENKKIVCSPLKNLLCISTPSDL